MEPLILPELPWKQEASWRGIMAVAQRVKMGWCLVGGQMVQLHCWERGYNPTRPTNDGDAALDIRAQRKGVFGGTTLETPGAQNVLDRAKPLLVSLGSQQATVFRPSLEGAIIGKAFAYSIQNQVNRDRHLVDFIVLTALIRARYEVGTTFNKREGGRVMAILTDAMSSSLVHTIEGGDEGLERMAAIMKGRAGAGQNR